MDLGNSKGAHSWNGDRIILHHDASKHGAGREGEVVKPGNGLDDQVILDQFPPCDRWNYRPFLNPRLLIALSDP